MEFISAIESVYHKLSDQDAQDLRAETNCLPREIKPPRSNITKEESKVLRGLREDKKRMVLTAGKGVAMVVMDRKEYMEKVEGLLAQPAYRPSIQTLEKTKGQANTNTQKDQKGNQHGGRVCIGPCSLLVALLPSSMGYQTSIKLVPP